MKVVLASSERLSGGILDALLRLGHEVVGVISPQAGFSRRKRPSFLNALITGHRDIGQQAQVHRIPFRLVSNMHDGALVSMIKQKRPDLLVVFGWPALIDNTILGLFPRGGMNIHPSLLPQLRGPDPLFHIIDKQAPGFGVSFHKITQELDAGPLYYQQGLEVKPLATYDDLYNQLLKAVVQNLPMALSRLVETPEGKAQVGAVTWVTRFRSGNTVLKLEEKPDAAERRTRACYAHHPRLTSCGGILLSFTGCCWIRYKELVYPRAGTVQAIGWGTLDISLGGGYVRLTGVRLWGKSLMASLIGFGRHVRPGQPLGTAQETRRLARRMGAL